MEEFSPSVHPSCFVHPTALIVGNVRVARECSIWPYAVLRGDEDPIEVGAGTNLQDSCVVHTDYGFPVKIGSEVTVGHRAVVHGADVGDASLIGIGATLLNGCVIGEGTVIGAHAVVTPGTRIPPNSLVLGVPGKVVKQDHSYREENLKNCEIYKCLAEEHQKRRFKTFINEVKQK